MGLKNAFKGFTDGLFGSSDRHFKKDEDGMYILSNSFISPQFNDYDSEIKKLDAVLKNPAMLKVVALQCDLFSLGKVQVYKGEKQIIDDPVLDLFKNPNPFQSGNQFLWDFMFWTMLGNSYCYTDSNIADTNYNKLYFLSPGKMYFPNEATICKDKLMLSKSAVSDLNKLTIEYRYDNGESIKIPISKIITISDLTNGTGNWLKGSSRIDALYKVISNSDAALDAENVNVRFSGKFMVAGKADPNDVSKIPLSEPEKESIEQKMNGRKSVHAVKSLIDIKRFVEDKRSLQLHEAYLNAYFIIGSMYGIPKDVLEAYNSSTYENQEKARAAHVSYTLQPKGNDFFQAFSNRFGYTDKNKRIVIDWSHLPFMQVFEKDRAQTKNTQAQTFQILVKNGVPIEEINKFLNTNFTINGTVNTGTN